MGFKTEIQPTDARFVNLVGKRFGRFTVMSYFGKMGFNPLWNCVCDCGEKRVVQRGNLFRPNPSCGCYRRENVSRIKKVHGMRHSRPYKIWSNMKNRCSNPKCNRSHIYHNRGITYCQQWETFSGFWKDMASGYDDHLTLERKDNDKGYDADNCCWATYSQQAKNRRSLPARSRNGRYATDSNRD